MRVHITPIFEKIAGEGFFANAQDSKTNSDIEQAEGLTLEMEDLSLERVLDDLYYLGERYPELARDLVNSVLARDLFDEPEVIDFLREYKRSLIECAGLEGDKPSPQSSPKHEPLSANEIKPAPSAAPRFSFPCA